MGIKSFLSLPLAKYVVWKNAHWKNNAVKVQNKLLLSLVRQAQSTQFGKDHNFEEITNYNEWKVNIPISDYEELKNYIQQIIEGKENVLWPEQVRFTV